MPANSKNHIKVGATSKNAKSVGGFSFGVTGGDDYGPTLTSITGGTGTGFYNAIIPPVGGYTLYQEVGGNIYARVANDDAECIVILKDYGYTGAENIADAITWAQAQNDVIARSAEYTLSDLPGATQPTTGQTSLYLTQIDGSNNWHYIVLDFTNNTITSPVDLGYSAPDYQQNIYYTNESGYMIVLYNDNDYAEVIYFFISANGVLVETYIASYGYNKNDSNGFKLLYVVDTDGGLFKYFDGFTVYTRNISTYSDFFVPYNYDLGGIDGGILTQRNENGTSYIEYNYQGTIIQIHNEITNDYNLNPYNYGYGTYTIIAKQFIGNGHYEHVYIYDNLTGNLIQDTDVSDYSFLSMNLDFYGTGKVMMLFRYWNDTNVPYRMVSYDGVLDRLIIVDQPNDGNYNDYNSHYTNDYPYTSNGNPSESFFYDFYDYSNNSYNNFMYQYNFFKTYSFYDGCLTPSVYVLNDSGDYYNTTAMGYSSEITNHMYRFISTGLTNLDILVLGDSTETIIPTDILICDYSNDGMNDLNSKEIGDSVYFETFSGNSVNYNNFTSYIVKPTSGSTFSIVASQSFATNNHNYWSGNGFVLIKDYDNSLTYYYNNSVSGFTQIDDLTSMNSNHNEYCFNPPYFERRLSYIFYSNDTFDAYVLTKNSISEKVTLEPNSGSYNVKIGINGVLHTYSRQSDNLIVMDVYDLSLNRTQRIVTNEYSWNDINVVKDRYNVQTDTGNGTYILYEITQTSYNNTVELPNNYYNGPAPNDYIYGW
jgi:hypothetical protein